MTDYSGKALRALESGGWRITETVHAGGSETDWHVHDQAHFCLLVAGGLVDEGRDVERRCGPGSMLYYPPGVEHRDRFLGTGARCLNLKPPRGAGPVFADVRNTPVLVSEPRTSWTAATIFDRLLATTDSAVDPADLHELTGLHSHRSEQRELPRWLVQARHVIERQWCQPVCLAEVAREVGISASHLAREFRHHFGCTVVQYAHRLRITHARDVLLTTDKPLSAVALDLGFADQSHFTRIFARLVGCPPARYRAASRAA